MADAPEQQSVAWRRGEAPVPVQVAVVHSDPDRIRDLEETSRDHGDRLDVHEKLLGDIRTHLGEIVTRIDRAKVYFLVTAVIIFGGTANGAKLVEAIGGLIK